MSRESGGDPRKTLLLEKEGTEMEMSSLVQDALLSLKIVFNFKEFFLKKGRKSHRWNTH